LLVRFIVIAAIAIIIVLILIIVEAAKSTEKRQRYSEDVIEVEIDMESRREIFEKVPHTTTTYGESFSRDEGRTFQEFTTRSYSNELAGYDYLFTIFFRDGTYERRWVTRYSKDWDILYPQTIEFARELEEKRRLSEKARRLAEEDRIRRARER
jgi:hypothetical protein